MIALYPLKVVEVRVRSKAARAILDCAKIKAPGWKAVFLLEKGLTRTMKIVKERRKSPQKRLTRYVDSVVAKVIR